ncbi:MAG: hypothetical protein FJY55_12230 [Betaproteobacteria bacterium]|nr:hypothetical protein [Betaproteobacteria bacterium]
MSAVPKTPMPAWTSGWTADRPFDLDYNFVPADSPWVPGPVTGMQQRDLGVTTASRGKMSARHVRVTDPAKVLAEWRALDADFQFMFVFKGSARLENAAGQKVTLERGVAAWQPAFLRHRIFDYSADFDMFELYAPAEPGAILGRDTPLPERARQFAGMQGQYLAETPASFVQGAGPRKYFRYRDLETRKPTDGRIHIHLVHAIEPMPGGTGWHTHTMRQLFYVVGGSAGWGAEGDTVHKRVNTWDAVCVYAGQKHDVPSFTADYKVLEICIPAEYETINAEAPKQ